MRSTELSKLKLDLALVDGAGHRRGADRVGGAGQGDVAFAGEQAGGGVEADPAGAGHVDLGPGVQVGEIGRRAGGPSRDLTSAVSCTR
jgi:hypothetical protein